MEPFFYTKFLNEIKKFDENIQTDNFWIITNEQEGYERFSNQCERKYNTYPSSIINLNENWKRLKLNWYIFKC